MRAPHSHNAKDARSLLYDLVVACRAYDSAKPAHVQEYSFSLDAAEAFLKTPRQSGPEERDAALELAAKHFDAMPLNAIYSSTEAAACCRALKITAPQEIRSTTATPVSDSPTPAAAVSEAVPADDEILDARAAWIEILKGFAGKELQQPGGYKSYVELAKNIVQKYAPSSEAGKELGASTRFLAAVRELVNGGPYDLTDSPKSLVGNLQRLVNECDAAEGRASSEAGAERATSPVVEMRTEFDPNGRWVDVSWGNERRRYHYQPCATEGGDRG